MKWLSRWLFYPTKLEVRQENNQLVIAESQTGSVLVFFIYSAAASVIFHFNFPLSSWNYEHLHVIVTCPPLLFAWGVIGFVDLYIFVQALWALRGFVNPAIFRFDKTSGSVYLTGGRLCAIRDIQGIVVSRHWMAVSSGANLWQVALRMNDRSRIQIDKGFCAQNIMENVTKALSQLLNLRIEFEL
jgi:hypothetical protein